MADVDTGKNAREVFDKYMRDPGGQSLGVNSSELEKLLAEHQGNLGEVDHSYRDRDISAAERQARGFDSVNTNINSAAERVRRDSISASSMAADAAAKQIISATSSLVSAAHADIISNIKVVAEGVDDANRRIVEANQRIQLVHDNLVQVDMQLNQLCSDFRVFVMADVRAKALQRAETKIIQIKQDLESKFSVHKGIRGNAVGILRATDLGVVRTETIITESEKALLKASGYWLAPALIALSAWIEDSKTDSDEHKQVALTALAEAYRLDRQKTALLFALVCRRAHLNEASDLWLEEYMSFQDPELVDRTCLVLINACAAGLLGPRDPEQNSVLATMLGWVNALCEPEDSIYRKNLVEYWINLFNATADKLSAPELDSYVALRQFAPETWPMLVIAFRGARCHEHIIHYLETRLRLRGFKENEDWACIDQELINLVSGFDVDELPYRREYEYQQLVVDLQGDESVAKKLRYIKDTALSEVMPFTQILASAATDDGDAANANQAAQSMSLGMQLPWVFEAHDSFTEQRRSYCPKTIPYTISGSEPMNLAAIPEELQAPKPFSGTLNVGDKREEEAAVGAFVNQVNGWENSALAAAALKTTDLALGIGGCAAIAIGLVLLLLGFTVNAGMALIGLPLFIAGAFLGFKFYRKYKRAKDNKTAIADRAQKERINGTIVTRMLFAEYGQFRKAYAEHDALATKAGRTISGNSLQKFEVESV